MNYELCEHGKRIGLDDCETCSVVGLKSQLRRMLEERNEARSKLSSYRERSIKHNSMGACCLLCHGAWAYSRGAEMHEGWCPNQETPK